MRSAAADRVFLRACAIGAPEEWDGHDAALAKLAPGQWATIVALGEEHGFSGLLARNLNWARQRSGLVIPTVDRLESLRRAQLVQHLARRAAARRATAAFEARGIPFVVFKGIVLAEEAYGDLSLRGFRDLDVMVPRERVGEAFDALVELGYREMLFGDMRPHLESGGHAVGMSHPDGTGVDLHWSFAPDISDPERVAIAWRNTCPASAGSSLPGLRFTPEMTLIHVAKHFHSHQYGEIKPLVDFHVVARAYAARMQGERVLDLARHLELLPVVEIAASLCERSFGTPRSWTAISHGPGRAGRLARVILTERFLLHSSRLSRSGNWARYLVASGSVRATIGSLLGILAPSRFLLSQFFGKPFRAHMYPLYYWRQLLKVITLARR
jgi:hypothetical protein